MNYTIKRSRMPIRMYGLCIATLVVPLPALASLGGNAASVAKDNAALNTNLDAIQTRSGAPSGIETKDITPPGSSYTVLAFKTPFGTEVHEYLFGGIVFGVAWRGADIPDLGQLLGEENYATYVKDVETQRQQKSSYAIRNSVTVKADALVVHSYGRSPHFQGNAYIPQQLPADVTSRDIK